MRQAVVADRASDGFGVEADSPDVVSVAGDPADAARWHVALLVVGAAAAGRLVDAPVVWLVALLVGLAAFVGAADVVSGVASGRSASSAISRIARLVPGSVPAVLAAGGTLALHAFGPRLDLLLALAGLAALVGWTIGLERRIGGVGTGASAEDERLLVAVAVAAAFVAFAGVAVVAGGPSASLDGAPSAPSGSVLPLGELALLVLADGLAAAVLGGRLARLRAAGPRNALLAAASSGVIVAVAAGALRALAIPAALGPALLTLVFFLWDAVTGATVAHRRTPRWAWEIALLAVLGAAVTALNARVG